MKQLAIQGGTPVRRKYLPYGHQWIDDTDIASVVEVLKSDRITQGTKIGEFEARVAEYCGSKFAVAVSSGTGALHAACAVAGISTGDEVITTPLSFVATSNAVVYCGGRPVFADVKEDTLTIDPAEIARKVSPRTKAILPVDFAGHPADYEEIMAIARERGLVVIEDAAHALGAEYKGRKIGGLANMTILSFHPVKHITTGEGGMVLTDNTEFYEKLKRFRHHGIIRDNPDEDPWHYNILDIGYNLRITDFQCALGLSQMSKLDSFIQRRREIAARYNRDFAGVGAIMTPIEKAWAKAVYHIYVVRIRPEQLKVGRQEIFKALQAENIGVSVHYPPIHLHPLYRDRFGYKRGDYPVTERSYDVVITLPIFPGMSDEDVDDVIEAVKKVIEYYQR